MTGLAKGLIFATLAMSVTLLGVSLAIFFSQQVQGSADKGSGSAPANQHAKEYGERVERHKKALESLQRVQKAYVARIPELGQLEEAYASHPDFYKKELEKLENGDGDMQTVSRVDGNVQFDGKTLGRVKMEPAKDGHGEAVQSAASYVKKISTELEELAKLSLKLTGDPKADDEKTKVGLLRWHELLTKSLFEVLEDKADPPTRGLRVELAVEMAKHEMLAKELEYLDDAMSKFTGDNESLGWRFDQMSARKTELVKRLKGKK
jgi:hypothetical protein